MTTQTTSKTQGETLIRHLEDFDTSSGRILERAIFNFRPIIIFLCLVVTGILGYQSTQLTLSAAFQKMIPSNHPYILNFLDNRKQLSDTSNALRIAVHNTEGSIFDAQYLETLRELNDELFLMPGVERPFMKSLWTPSVRWTGVTEEGLDGGPVIPDDYDGSQASLDQVRLNVERSGEVGQLVSGNYASSIILVPLREMDHEGNQLDYHAFSAKLEELRAKYQKDGIEIHITGFAKVVGDLIDGLKQVLVFFAITIGIISGNNVSFELRRILN